MNASGQVWQPILFGLTDTLHSSPFLNSEQICQQLGTNIGNLAFVYAIKHQLVGLAERVERGKSMCRG